MQRYVNVLAGRPQLYIVPDDAVELTEEQALWMLERPHVATIDEILNMEEAPPPAPTLDELKSLKIRDLNAWNAAAIAAGYTDTQGRTWAVADRDRAAWGELLSAAVQLYGLTDEELLPMPIREADSVTMHTVTLAEYRVILRGVAETYMTIDATYATLRAQVNSATTIEELEAIVVG